LKQLAERDVCIARTAHGLLQELAHGALVRVDGVARRPALAFEATAIEPRTYDCFAKRGVTQGIKLYALYKDPNSKSVWI
jgi:hypothetical protein